MQFEVKGTLIPIGGNEDKGRDKPERYSFDFIHDSILSHIVREAGGTKARIVVVPTASSIPLEVSDRYLEAFEGLGCTNLEILDVRGRSQSETKRTIATLEQADCVLFSGGDQSRIIDFFKDTQAHHLFKERYVNENFVLAGTSAGAMAMSGKMVSGGSSKDSLYKGAVKMRAGLGLIPDLVIDTHFIRRGRFGRLAEAMAIYPGLLGLGLAEDTGILIKNGNSFRVIGSGMVLLFDPSGLRHNNHQSLHEGTPISMSNLIVHILANNDLFTIADRKIEISPLEAGWI